MPIERRRLLILGIHQQRVGGDFRAYGAVDRVGEQSPAQALRII